MEWRKGTKVLKSGEKYQMKQNASVNELLISNVVPEDSGDYSCVCGEQKTSASVNIKGRNIFSQCVFGQGNKKYIRLIFFKCIALNEYILF